MTAINTVDAADVARFSALADTWWDPNGPLKTLHDINPARLSWMMSYTSLHNKTVLDVGCGGGILAEAMAKAGAHVVGIDASHEGIEAARQHAKLSPELSLTYQCTPIETYEGPLVDIVTCLEMLEHTAHPERVIQAAVARLKPQGMLFLSTINQTLTAYATVVVAAEYVLSLLPRGTHNYEQFITPAALAKMVRQAGCDVMGLTGLGYDPFTRTAKEKTGVSANYLMACQRA